MGIPGWYLPMPIYSWESWNESSCGSRILKPQPYLRCSILKGVYIWTMDNERFATSSRASVVTTHPSNLLPPGQLNKYRFGHNGLPQGRQGFIYREGLGEVPSLRAQLPTLKTYVSPFFLLEQSEGNVTKGKIPNYLQVRFHVFEMVTIVANSSSLSVLGSSMYTGIA